MSEQWWIQHRGRDFGPMTLAQIQGLARADKIRPGARLREPGSAEWVDAALLLDRLRAPEPEAPSGADSEAEAGVRPRGRGRWAAVTAVAGLLLAVAALAVWRSSPPADPAPLLAAAETLDASDAAEEDDPAPAKGARRGPAAKGARRRGGADAPQKGMAREGGAARKRAGGRPAGDAREDLDVLLPLLGGEGFLADTRLQTPDDAAWLVGIGRLKGAADPAVAAAATACARAALGRVQADELREQTGQTNQALGAEANELIRRNADAFVGLLDGVPADLEEQVENGSISRDTANAIRSAAADREVRAAMSMAPLVRAFASSYLAGQAGRSLRQLVEAEQATVLADHLRPPLRAQAGARTEAPPLEVRCGFGGWRQGWSEGYLTVTSRAEMPLTRVTLLVEIKSGAVSRRVAYHLPRLGPGERFRAAPVLGLNSTFREVELSSSRYSIWCDQLAAEDVAATDLSKTAAQVEYASEAFQQGTEYLTREVDPRYGVTLTAVQPEGDGLKVTARVARYRRDDPGQIHAEGTCQSLARGAPPDRLPEVTLPLPVGEERLTLVVKIGPDGELSRRLLNPYHFESALVTPAVIQQKSDFDARNAPIARARRLALVEGRRAEAEALLRDYIASNPGPEWVERAQKALDQMDSAERMSGFFKIPSNNGGPPRSVFGPQEGAGGGSGNGAFPGRGPTGQRPRR